MAEEEAAGSFVFEDPEQVGDLGSARLTKYSLPSFCAELTHEPCDRHAYSAFWTRDLDQKPVNSTLQRFTQFLTHYDVPMFKGDGSFVVLTHQFVMLGRAGPKGTQTNNEMMPLCLHSLEALVSPTFIQNLEAWMETTRPKLEKFNQEFGDSTTLFKAVALKTHTGMVELEVKIYQIVFFGQKRYQFSNKIYQLFLVYFKFFFNFSKIFNKFLKMFLNFNVPL